MQSKFNPYHRGRTGNAGNEDFYTASATPISPLSALLAPSQSSPHPTRAPASPPVLLPAFQASAELGVTITAYCPLNDWPSKLKAVDDVHVAQIAARHGKTAAQVILRWGVQLGLTMLTRSRDAARLEAALQLWDFELSEGEMARISGLAWFVLAPSNRVPSSVVDTYGVDSRDTRAYQLVPRGRPPVAEPIKACDMAWDMLGARGRKVEL